jgi:hypothetical protein
VCAEVAWCQIGMGFLAWLRGGFKFHRSRRAVVPRGMEKRTRDSTSCDASREGGAELMSKKSRGRKTGRNYFHCGLETRIVYDHKLMKD